MESNLDKKIQDFLLQENPEYWEGVELYTAHPKSRQNIVVNLNQKWDKGFMHEKLITELENCIGIVAHSNKKALLKHRAAVIPYKMIDDAKAVAPVNYEYRIKLDKLPAELKALVIEKGQLYNALEKGKKELANVGQANDDQSVAKRMVILKTMKTQIDKIKSIHSLLVNYDNTRTFSAGELEILNAKAAGGTTEVEQFEDDLNDDQKLEIEFKYLNMNYYQRKDLLVKLRSSVPKQEQRAAETNKEDVKKKNTEKAMLGRKMIALLENYFKDTQEPEL